MSFVHHLIFVYWNIGNLVNILNLFRSPHENPYVLKWKLLYIFILLYINEACCKIRKQHFCPVFLALYLQ